ncbi:tRNA(Ile)-lysidine synthetase, N-terminal domain-containing protein [Abditibacterium utsteinense]|uniref:tRNA(Ile)-lysidine synthase n=1 Tax=Abditibacterium utsteinense TaxID=1960156 RepID=A0A2S8SUK3_9BACT|nr:tRNA lysidine(34) synthetase TilS [Abditibacterium utsteinense]PQV64439.1 tRNA(Ile)-lysidine synthetase, N-terminal domain-containing protein [Abditibacterium utsteinense]
MEMFDADEELVSPTSRLLAAVSSGADSMALLFWLHSLGRDFVVGHINHNLHELRPEECARDEDFVRQKCVQIGAPFRALTIDLPRKNGHVNEVVAREARYAALIQIARESGCERVATAHTATDGLESAILNLMRGGAPGGWLGIAPQRVLDGDILLVRPFWRLPRKATRQLLRDANWSWREDASNRDPLFRRNRVRHEILPILGDISGRHSDSISLQHAKNAQIARDENVFLEKLAFETLETLVLKRESDLIALDGLKFQRLEMALQRRVLRLGARQICPELRDLEWQKIEATRQCVVCNDKRAVWTWRKELRVEWTGAGAGNRLRFWRVKMPTEGIIAFK